MKTKNAVAAILRTDDGLTDVQRREILNAIERVARGGAAAGNGRGKVVLKWKEAAGRLGVSVMSVRNYAHAGRLKPVSYSGRRAVGVTAESVESFILNAGGGSVFGG